MMFFEIGVLKNFVNFTGKHLCWSLFLIKFLTNFIKDTLTQAFSCEIQKNFKNTFSTEHLQQLLLSKETPTPVKFAKFLRTSFFTEHLQWLLLNGHFSLVRCVITRINMTFDFLCVLKIFSIPVFFSQNQLPKQSTIFLVLMQFNSSFQINAFAY